MKSKCMERQMNKEQSADDPSVDLIRVKKYADSTISMSYPDVVIGNGIEHKVSQSIQSNWGSVGEANDNNMKDYSLVVDWSP